MATDERASSSWTQPGQKASDVWPDWHARMADFRRPSAGRAVVQLASTLLPYAFLWFLMIRSIQLGYPYVVTLVLAGISAAFLVRLFILFHDCVHSSLFPQKRANAFFGHLLGVLVFTPFDDWRFSHLRHHATYANLDTRGFGDIWTMTLKEYEDAPKRKRLAYRLYRNPFVVLGLGALFTFVLRFRLPARKTVRKERMSVLFTNLLIVCVFLIAAWAIGWRTYLLIQLPVVWIAGTGGIWLFYVQHQFEGVYWARKQEWNPLKAAMQGSSFYKLPPILRWFSGSIGYHHVHHMNSRIPNYRLKPCYDAIPALQSKPPLMLGQSLACIRLKVWDEKNNRLTGFP